MRNPLDIWRQRQARQRYMPRARGSKHGTTSKVALAAVVLILVSAALLELRRGDGATADVVEYARANTLDPLDIVEVAGRSRPLLFLADISTAPAPKQFAARAVERLAGGSGLDLLVLDVPADEQPFIDRYLATAPEDVSILLARPRAVREGDPASRALVDLYRTVWRVNQQLGAARRIRIVAADHPAWPPRPATAPQEAARVFGERDAHMLQTVMERELQRNRNARVLFFMDGLHVLRSGGARVQTGGARPVDATWLAALLAGSRAQDVFTILVDAAPGGAISTSVAAYRGTALADALRRGGLPAGTGLRTAPELDAISRTPIRVVGTTGLEFMLEPRSAPLSSLANAYIYFGN